MRKKILIIGGGFTGLTAALRLAQQGGFDITLVEKAKEFGGLAAGVDMAGTSLEKTYHYLFTTDDCFVRLVNELGVEDRLFWAPTTNAIFRNGRVHPFTTALHLLRFSPCSLAGRLRTGLTIFYLKHRKEWRQLAGQSAQAWMTRACGESAMDTIWTPLLRGKFGPRYAAVSMGWLWTRIHMRANSRPPRGPEKLGYFRGGFKVVVDAMEKELRQHGVKLLNGTTVEKISADRTAVVAGETVSFDACLFAGPSNAFVRLLPVAGVTAGYAEKLASIEYLGAICLVFTSDQPLGDNYWVNVNEPGAPFLVFINHTRLVGTNLFGGRHVYYIGAYLPEDDPRFKLTDEALTQLWFGYLPKLFPGFDPRRVQEQRIFRFMSAQHVVDTNYEAKIPDYRTPLPGVYLSNFSQVYPEDRGTNFAVREGEKVAALMRQDLT